MPYYCFKCQSEIELAGSRAGRRDECPKCRADLHVCRNCSFWDPSAYNECREPQAERVLDKTSSNYCDYFEFRQGPPAPSRAGVPGASPGAAAGAKPKALKDLEALFKK